MTYDRQLRPRRGIISLNDLLIWCFSVWPFFWNIWMCFRGTVAISSKFPLIFLAGLTIVSLLTIRKERKKIAFFTIWLVFLLAIIFSGIRGIHSVALEDISVIFCGFLFCFSMQNRSFDTNVIIKCLYRIGLFIALTIILDAVTGIFQTALLPLYSDKSKVVIARRFGRFATGGILPYPASSGCFLYAGIGAYICFLKGKRPNFNNWLVISVYLVAILLLQKRGFILDIAITAFAIWICGWRFEKAYRANLKKQIRFVFMLILIVSIGLGLYFFVPMLKETVDAYITRFTTSDNTLSGRTLLYALAYRLFRTNPILGIGWGMFRGQTSGIFSIQSTYTYEVHNVYLQLLCETGIIGLIAFVITAVGTLVMTIKKFRIKVKSEIKDVRYYSLKLSLYLLFFFLAYCTSGNPLYDYNFLITFFVGILLMVQWNQKEKDGD